MHGRAIPKPPANSILYMPDTAPYPNGAMNTPSRSSFIRIGLCLAISAGTGTWIGCAENEAGFDIRIPADERPDVDASVVARGTLSLPEKTPFNLNSFQSNQENDGRGESTSVGSDGAVCRAEARSGGSAWGKFVLGYHFDNATSGPLDAVVKLRVKHVESNTVAGAEEGAPDGTSTTTAVSFRIQDTNGVIVRSESLASGTLSAGPRSVSDTHELSFDARFEAGRGYYIAIYGHCEAKAGPNKSAAVSLEISQYNLDIAWKPAAASRAEPATDLGESQTVVLPSAVSSEGGVGS